MAANSVVGYPILPKFKLVQAFIVVLVVCKMKEENLKMKAQECSQHFSYYKTMGIFPDAEGQLTPKFLVRSCRISNPSETLWLSSLPTRIKKSQSKNEEARVGTRFSPLLPYESCLLPWKPEF